MTTIGAVADYAIGIDLGGTKIAGIALRPDGTVLAETRLPSPKGDYRATLQAVCTGVANVRQNAFGRASIGIGIPGSLSPATGLVQNANSTWLNGQDLRPDLEALLGQKVRIANDANCFALSEASDGAGRDAHLVFGVILGTGCGGGIVLDGRLINGPRAIAGEWGHNPLPWPAPEEVPGPLCWCGLNGCMEAWVSGPAMAADHKRMTGETLSPEEIVARADAAEEAAQATLHRHASRLARGLAGVVNLLDPDVIVLGGGLSDLAHLYHRLPRLMAPYIFAADRRVDIRRPVHGATSGVRGAARLWQSA